MLEIAAARVGVACGRVVGCGVFLLRWVAGAEAEAEARAFGYCGVGVLSSSCGGFAGRVPGSAGGAAAATAVREV